MMASMLSLSKQVLFAVNLVHLWTASSVHTNCSAVTGSLCTRPTSLSKSWSYAQPVQTLQPVSFVTVALVFIHHCVCWPQQNMSDRLFPKWQAYAQLMVHTAEKYGSMEKSNRAFPPLTTLECTHSIFPHTSLTPLHTLGQLPCVCVCVLKRDHHKMVTTPHQEASIFLQSWPVSQLIINNLMHAHTICFLLHILKMYQHYGYIKLSCVILAVATLVRCDLFMESWRNEINLSS